MSNYPKYSEYYDINLMVSQKLHENIERDFTGSVADVIDLLEPHCEEASWANNVRYDRETGNIRIIKELPYTGSMIGEWKEIDTLHLKLWINTVYRVDVSMENARLAVLAFAFLNSLFDEGMECSGSGPFDIVDIENRKISWDRADKAWANEIRSGLR